MKFISQILFVIITGFILLSCNSQPTINTDLKKELDAIMFTDQAFRRQYDPKMSEKERRDIADSLDMDYDTMRKNLLVLMHKYDAENIEKIETIIAKYGYPGKSLVGEPTNRAAFLVIQHSNKISELLPIVKLAAENGELPFSLYAMMIDRQLMYKGAEQIYGSQGDERNGVAIIWPIKDAGNVNYLRKKAGFPETIEEYSKVLFGKDFIFRNYTLKEVEGMFAGQIIYE